jgi:predicted phosphate transport protein (TIGR00153 family)
MFDFIKKAMPREEKFFDLFEAHAVKLQAGARMLSRIMDGGKDLEANCAALMKLEDEADHISHDVMLAIRRSFITPFDRSDIKALISSMDDAIDQMNKTAKAVLLYEVTEFEPKMKEMAELTIQLADKTAAAVPLLRQINANSSQLHIMTAAMIRLEEDTDHLNDAGLKALLKGKAKADPMAFIIGSQFYEHLEKVADRFEDVANVINDIVIEHV